ncbi:MAG: 50S ribosomal protein L25 [Acidobacteriaceae bacterium]|nr:50S ribosomal protein L25 [Acidobacteriaceae bacterium]MBV9295312.1 50S ribosomal protein L25 [Acidobacteriaceae bacterium]MBV9765639.1 50S ribosomal protein L25 [Acidobacteriaceae bacterium]
MRKEITITAEPRDSRGKNEARRLRSKGSVPAVVYGGPSGPKPVAVSPKELTRILNSKTGHNTIFNLGLADAGNTPVMIVDWQYDPIKDSLLHVDLKRIDLTQRITVKVPIVTQGEPKGVKIQGGIHEIVTREIEIECLPNDIPEQFVVDVSELMIGQNIRIGQIEMGDSVRLISQPDTVVSHVVALRAEETPAAETAGESPAAGAPAAEPEVIKKGKKEEEGGGGEAAAPPKKK